MKNAEKQNKAVNFKSEKINGKKGFTLIELVVTIAILATLAAIAIPVVSATLKSTIINKAKTNARTLEYAFKEADAAVAASDNTKYVNASTNTIQISEVISANKLAEVLEPENLSGTMYYPVVCRGKVYYACDSNGDSIINSYDKDIEGNNLPDTAVLLYNKNTNRLIDGNITTLKLSSR